MCVSDWVTYVFAPLLALALSSVRVVLRFHALQDLQHQLLQLHLQPPQVYFDSGSDCDCHSTVGVADLGFDLSGARLTDSMSDGVPVQRKNRLDHHRTLQGRFHQAFALTQRLILTCSCSCSCSRSYSCP